jgi:hypothetical protein
VGGGLSGYCRLSLRKVYIMQTGTAGYIRCGWVGIEKLLDDEGGLGWREEEILLLLHSRFISFKG